MRKGICLVMMVMWGSGVFGQAPVWEWARSAGGTQSDVVCNSIKVDVANNVYTIGSFTTYTVDFDPGQGVFNLYTLNSEAIFISKLDASGNFVWAKQIDGITGGSGSAYSVVLDSQSNIYLTGYFNGTVDFDPDTNVYNLTGAGSKNIFIAKFDSTGSLIWAKQFEGNGYNAGLVINLDTNENIYVSGVFNGTSDFDPDLGVYNLTGIGNNDLFVCKLNSTGGLIWAKSMGGAGSTCAGYSLSIDYSGYAYITGNFLGTVDFNPDTGTFYMSVNPSTVYNKDPFILKLDSQGSFVWAKAFHGMSWDNSATASSIDFASNIFITGYFTSVMDFDPDTSTYFLNTNTTGTPDLFITKLNSLGNFVWAKHITNCGARGFGLSSDHFGNVFTTGYFNYFADFDPGPAVFNLSSTSKLFILKLDSTGNFVWAKGNDGNGMTGFSGKSITLNTNGNVYVGGSFSWGGVMIVGNDTLYNSMTIGPHGTNPQGREDMVIFKLDTSLTLNINEISNLSIKIFIYPNPTSSSFTITSPSIIDQIEITDVMGRVVYRDEPKDRSFTVNMQHEGLYFVSVVAGDERVTRKVVVGR